MLLDSWYIMEFKRVFSSIPREGKVMKEYTRSCLRICFTHWLHESVAVEVLHISLWIKQCGPLQLILCERTTRTFLADTGKKILSTIIVKAQKVRTKPHSWVSSVLIQNFFHEYFAWMWPFVSRAQGDLRKCLKRWFPSWSTQNTGKTRRWSWPPVG